MIEDDTDMSGYTKTHELGETDGTYTAILTSNKDMKNVLFFIFVMFSVIGRVVLCKAYLPEVHHQKYLKIK